MLYYLYFIYIAIKGEPMSKVEKDDRKVANPEDSAQEKLIEKEPTQETKEANPTHATKAHLEKKEKAINPEFDPLTEDEPEEA